MKQEVTWVLVSGEGERGDAHFGRSGCFGSNRIPYLFPAQTIDCTPIHQFEGV